MKKASPAGKSPQKPVVKKSAKSKAGSPKVPASRTRKSDAFPIVGIGASAGGLEAITDLLRHLTRDTGMAFIYVQHLSPDHESILSSLLSKTSKIPVLEAANGMKIQPDKVFIIPAGKVMKIKDGNILLSPRLPKNKVNLLIDVFFTSLAEQFREKVIGVILSGSATDGTNGMRAIKNGGGVTFAQDDSAKFDSMPKSAIAAGVVDFVMSPSQIAAELVRISQHPYIRSVEQKKKLKADDIDSSNPELKSILHLLRQTFGVNFSLYKINTIKRRIMRRMLLCKISSLKAYAIWLNDKKSEQEVLFNDLLINVTNFFRDAEAYKYLKTTLFPALLKGKHAGEPLRIWITACSSGEEAYSMAMTISEIQETGRFSNVPVQIFATDLSKQAISKARIGVYTKQDIEQVAPKRLKRFFLKFEGGYRIVQKVRDMCVFAPHNVLSDPPFSRVDFISCCNLLIYLDTVAQKKVLSTFHYALNKDGYLMLGKSETAASAAPLFTAVNNKLKVYSRKKNSGSGVLPKPDSLYSGQPVEDFIEPKSKNMKSASSSSELDTTVNALLLAKYVPPSVVINQQMEIIQFRGNTSLFLQHPEGKASLNIMKMARAEIAFELRNAITKAFKTRKPVLKKGIEIKGGGTLVALEAVPLSMENDEPAVLVLFTQTETDDIDTGGKKKSLPIADAKRISRMEEEIAAYREDLLSISHTHEAAMEELQSANEEVLSSNEELRSINEELETSKEEIQSSNEELATTNQELQTRNELLNESYKYSEAIISTIHDPMIILDKDLRVKTANRSFYQRFYLTEEETDGMSLYDLAGGKWNIPKLRELLNDINSKKSGFKDLELEQTFPHIGRVIMRLNAKRIIQQAHREQLILLAIADITDVTVRQRDEKQLLEQEIDSQTRLAAASRMADEYIRNVFMQAPVAVMVYTGQSFIIDLVNDEAVKTWGIVREDVLGKPLFEVMPELREEGLDGIMKTVYQTGEPYTANEYRLPGARNKNQPERFFNFALDAIRDINGVITGLTATGIDVTQEVLARRKIEKQSQEFESAVQQRTKELNEANAELAATNIVLKKVNKELESFAYVSSHDLQEPLRKIQLYVSRILSQEMAGLSEKAKEYFDRVLKSSVRMQVLIEDLLAFSRISTADQEWQQTDLYKITAEVKNELKELIEEKHGSIEIKELCEARVIPFQFHQLMQNLISNSLKFIVPGRAPVIVIESKIGKGVELGHADLLPDGHYCHVRVTDNGIGFEQEFSEQIFEVFQRLHGQQDYPGTGIGLAIAKKIVDNHEGIITATSELGKGTRFDIYLPQ